MIELLPMFPGAVNSPETFLTVEVSETDTIITLQSAVGFPNTDEPYLVVLGGGFSNAETIRVTAISGNVLTAERGYQGTAQEWPQGTTAAINFTEAHYRALVENIKALGCALDYTMDNTFLTAAIFQFPITQDDYFCGWDLFLIDGGINSPLEVWGFTNAKLIAIASSLTIDINNNTATLYTIPAYSGRTWDINEYKSGVYILSAEDLALLLIRR